MTSKPKNIIIFMIVLSAALVIGGAAWATAEGVRGAKFDKATATVTSCQTQDVDGKTVTVKAFVSFEANGVKYDNVLYVGDLSRCKEGAQMRVYYKKSEPSGGAYSKSSDLGFALMLLGGGALWLAIVVAYAVVVKKSGY